MHQMFRFIAIVICALAVAAPANARSADPFVSTQPKKRQDYWQQRQDEISAYLKDSADLSPVKLVFVGDSITDFWHLDKDPWVAGEWFGRSVWDQSFGASAGANRAINIGISGDRMEHLLYRLLPQAEGGLGHLDRADLDPDYVILMIGINNSWEPEQPVVDSICAGIKAIVRAIHQRKPRATIVLQSLLPTQELARNHEVVLPVNARLETLPDDEEFADYVRYLDLYSGFVDTDGLPISRYFADPVHPNRAGYAIWRDRLLDWLARNR